MLAGKEVITLKREVWLHTPPQLPLPALVNGIEEGIFWTSLPRDGRQVLVLQESQKVKVGVSLQRGFYVAETKVLAIGKDNKMFYGLAIPDHFEISQERQFVRVDYPTSITFKTANISANTTMVNFSAGGVMVYLVPELEKVIHSGQEIFVYLNIDGIQLESEVRMAWKKLYDNIPFAGFEFVNITYQAQENLVDLSRKLSEKQK
ncbi:MAG: PilZ domain-containing protein [Bacillota bacterium]